MPRWLCEEMCTATGRALKTRRLLGAPPAMISALWLLGGGVDAQSEGVEFDESSGVALVIDIVGLEGDDFWIVQRVRRAASCDEAVAFVEFAADFASDVLLALGDCRL